jgi:hypothetical protein
MQQCFNFHTSALSSRSGYSSPYPRVKPGEAVSPSLIGDNPLSAKSREHPELNLRFGRKWSTFYVAPAKVWHGIEWRRDVLFDWEGSSTAIVYVY